MAERKKKGVPHHPLVEALASDPNSPPTPATKLFGFPGPAAEADATRLWLDEDLTTYVDVPDAAILHSRTLDDDQGTYLWVDPAATLTYSSAQSHQVQADFLGGSIAARNLAAVPPRTRWGAMADFEFPTPQTFGSQCLKPMTETARSCKTWQGDCRTPEWPCPPVESVDIFCPVVSVDRRCPDDVPPRQVSDGCPVPGGGGTQTSPGLVCNPHLTDVVVQRPWQTSPHVVCVPRPRPSIFFPCITPNCP